jgi:hypothetical protein
MDYVLVIGLLIATIYPCKRIPLRKIGLQLGNKPENRKTRVIPGSDSPFYKIIKYLEHRARPRQPGESVRIWLQRLSNEPNIERAELQQSVDQHYQYRFDSRDNGVVDKDRFSENVQAWLTIQTKNGA